jgi:secondary thiamine-phosphate synthase enzyme
MHTLSIRTDHGTDFIEVERGVLYVFVPHTTAGVTINENADPTVLHDLEQDLARLIPARQAYYHHREGNSASHLKASLIGSSVILLVQGGELVLGRWQGVYLCEFDGPRTRTVFVHPVTEMDDRG